MYLSKLQMLCYQIAGVAGHQFVMRLLETLYDTRFSIDKLCSIILISISRARAQECYTTGCEGLTREKIDKMPKDVSTGKVTVVKFLMK